MKLQDQILESLVRVGSQGATITEISRKVSVERHTLSKYLSMMHKEGLLNLKEAGKAKLWFINKTPLQYMSCQTPENLTYTERILLDIISQSPLGFIVVDRHYTIQFMNCAMTQTYGDVTNRTLYEAILGLPHPLRLKKINAVVAGAKNSATEVVRDSRGHILDCKASKLMNPDGSLSTVLIVEDITERTISEEQLRRSEERFRKIFEHSSDAIFVFDAHEDRILEANTRACHLLGYEKKDILAMPLSSIHPKDMKKLASTVRRKGYSLTDKLLCKTKKGKISVEISASAFELNGKDCIIAMVHDPKHK